MVVDRGGRLEENSRGGFSTLDFYIRKRGGKGEGIWRGVERARGRIYEKLPSNLLKRHSFSWIFLKSLNLGPRHCRLPFRHGLCLGLKDAVLFVKVTKFRHHSCDFLLRQNHQPPVFQINLAGGHKNFPFVVTTS